MLLETWKSVKSVGLKRNFPFFGVVTTFIVMADVVAKVDIDAVKATSAFQLAKRIINWIMHLFIIFLYFSCFVLNLKKLNV